MKTDFIFFSSFFLQSINHLFWWHKTCEISGSTVFLCVWYPTSIKGLTESTVNLGNQSNAQAIFVFRYLLLLSYLMVRIRIIYWWQINSRSFTRTNEWENQFLDFINNVNLEMQFSEPLAEDIVDEGSTFQFLIVSGKNIRPGIWELKS